MILKRAAQESPLCGVRKERGGWIGRTLPKRGGGSRAQEGSLKGRGSPKKPYCALKEIGGENGSTDVKIALIINA